MTISDPSNRETAPALSDERLKKIVADWYNGPNDFVHLCREAIKADREQQRDSRRLKAIIHWWFTGEGPNLRNALAPEELLEMVDEAMLGSEDRLADARAWAFGQATVAQAQVAPTPEADREQRPTALSEAAAREGWKVSRIEDRSKCCDNGVNPDGSVSGECCGNGACGDQWNRKRARESWAKFDEATGADLERAITGEPVALTDERIEAIFKDCTTGNEVTFTRAEFRQFARAIEAEFRAAPITGETSRDVAAARLEWLHSPASNNVDGYEWGVYRVKWVHGKAAEVWQTNADFSDLDAAMGSRDVAAEGGMVSVTKEDANNYCQILTLLGMEEEGDPVPAVQELLKFRDATNEREAIAAEVAARTPAWKFENEFAPFHPQASHVSPEYRDGWNDCYRAVAAEGGKA